MTKRNKKDIKNNLSHINAIYPVFKLKSIKEMKEVNDKYIQSLLKSYIQDEHMLITDEQIQISLDKLKELYE